MSRYTESIGFLLFLINPLLDTALLYYFDIPSWMTQDYGNGDNVAPVITILSPLNNSRYNTIAPSYMISIIEDNLDSCYYIISWEGGESPPFIANSSGSIDQALWDTLPPVYIL